MKKVLFYGISLILLLIFFFSGIAFCAEKSKSDFFDISADNIRADEDHIYASGNVVIEQKGVKIKSGEIRYDNKSSLISVPGEVHVEYNGDKFKGKRLLYNVKTYEAVLYDVSGSTRSLSFDNGEMKGRLFFDARKLLSGSNEINFYNVKTTTCDLPEPHYYITAKRITVFPGDKLIIRDTAFYLNNKFVFNLPAVVYSLKPRDTRQRLQNTLPKISSNNTDGFVVKEAFNYLFDKTSYGTVNVDWYQNSGIGLGLNHYFDFKEKGDGAVYYYKLGANKSTLTRREYGARLSYLLPSDIRLAYLYSSSFYQFPNQTNFPIKSSSISLSKIGNRSSFAASSSLYNVGFNLNQGYNFYHTYNISSSLKSFFNFDYSKNSSNAGETYNAHPVLRLYNQGKLFDTQFSYERTGGSLQNGLDREPEVSFISHRTPIGLFDFQASGSYGMFREKPATNRISRSFIELALPYKIWKITNKNYIDSNTYLNKYWYGDGKSYKIFFNRTGIFSQLSNFSNVRADFFYQSPKGNTAIGLDRINYYKLLLGSVNVFDGKNYYFTAGSSIDLTTPAGQRWRDLFCRLRLTPGKFGIMDFGANYNTQTRHWQNLDTQLDLMVTRTLNFKYWASYDISARRMITQDYSIVKDFHCWEARLVYRGFSSQWWFDVVLKAFPSEDITIGANQTKPILPQEGWQRF